jgi:hypothetical protein
MEPMESHFNFYADVPWAEVVNTIPFLPMVAIVSGFLFLTVASIGMLSLAFVKAVRGGGATQDARRIAQEERRIFNDLRRGFERMTVRVESLETLFIGTSQTEAYEKEC